MTTTAAPPAAILELDTRKRRGEQAALLLVVTVPFVAVLAAIPLLWGRGVSTTDVVLAVVFYAVSGHGITVGFHRYFTHGAFKATRALRVALAVAGSMAIQGPVIRWVADHRRHHAFSDRDGDPHSPHRFGTGALGTLRGLWHAHLGWLFDPEQTSLTKYAPDLLADRAIVWVHRLFPLIMSTSLLLPALLGGLISWSWQGAVTAFLWAGLVRVFVLHHVTWSINSVCHMFGSRPYRNRDRSTNFWPLALISMGESWHNLHHADPTLARHGVERGQIDTSAALIELFAWFGWARDVRWPDPQRLALRRA